MKAPLVKPVRCAIYTRVSTEHGLDQEFNSLDAQYEAASAYIKSQAHAGWTQIRSRYDDGGYSGGSTEPTQHPQNGDKPCPQTRIAYACLTTNFASTSLAAAR
jgi:Resolvase, N terminal domain